MFSMLCFIHRYAEWRCAKCRYAYCLGACQCDLAYKTTLLTTDVNFFIMLGRSVFHVLPALPAKVRLGRERLTRDKDFTIFVLNVDQCDQIG
jgi:hypothetical protein